MGVKRREEEEAKMISEKKVDLGDIAIEPTLSLSPRLTSQVQASLSHECRPTRTPPPHRLTQLHSCRAGGSENSISSEQEKLLFLCSVSSVSPRVPPDVTPLHSPALSLVLFPLFFICYSIIFFSLLMAVFAGYSACRIWGSILKSL